jgi:hypothetical protein
MNGLKLFASEVIGAVLISASSACAIFGECGLSGCPGMTE